MDGALGTFAGGPCRLKGDRAVGSKFTELIVDCRDPDRLARFWSQVLDWSPTGTYEGAVEIAGPEGSLPTIVFSAVHERKAIKNRLHIDVNPVGCTRDEEVERLLR